MAVFDIDTDIEYSDGSVRRLPVRVDAASREEAVKMVADGKGEVLTVPPSAQRPTSSTEPALYAQPPQSAEQLGGETLYNPRPAPAEPGKPGYLERALRAAGSAALSEGKRIALPAGLSMAAEYGGGLVPGLAQVPPQLRAAGGSVLGTAANMALGIEKPSLEQLMLSAATPALARGAGSRAVRAIPGARGAYAADLVSDVEQLPDLLRRGGTQETVEELFTKAYTLNPQLEIRTTASSAAGLVKEEKLLDIAPTLKHGTQPLATDLRKAGTAVPEKIVTTTRQSDLVDSFGRPFLSEETTLIPGKDGKVSLQELDRVRQAIGARISTTPNEVERGQYKRLYGAILNDLEEAATEGGEKGAEALLLGIKEARRQFSADDLTTIISGPAGAISKPRQGDGLQTVDFGKILKELERPHKDFELLAEFLNQNPAEKKQLVDLLEDMNRRNVKLLPVAGAITGSSRNTMLFGAIAGGLKLAGVDSGTAASLGGLAPFALQGLSRALLTERGRALIRQAYEPSGVLNPLQITLQLAGQSLRQRAGTQPLTTVGTALHNTLQFGAEPGQPPPTQPPQ